LKDENGNRPVNSQYPRFQTDPDFKDYILFYEYFHGDNGRGVGASHQTGWTGLIAKILMPRFSKKILQNLKPKHRKMWNFKSIISYLTPILRY
jgi:hypothetical protein